MTESDDNNHIKAESDLRIEFIHKPTQKSIFYKKYPFPVQNMPFEYGIKVTNIGNTAFKGAVVKKFNSTIANGKMGWSSITEPQISTLNPKESVELFFDKYTSPHAGSVWTSLTLQPLKQNNVITTYQFDKNHNIDNAFKNKNSWGDSYFIQGQLELLQTRTNTLILLLTSITVIEAIFGLKEIIKTFSKLLSISFSFLAKAFNFIAI